MLTWAVLHAINLWSVKNDNNIEYVIQENIKSQHLFYENKKIKPHEGHDIRIHTSVARIWTKP